MTKKQKDIITKGIIIPVTAALILTIISVVIIRTLQLPYSNGSTSFADFSSEQITEINQFDGEVTDVIRRVDIGAIDSNTIIGSITISDSTYPLIFNANDVNAMGKMNITGKLIPGETGVSFMEVYKDEGAKLKLVNTDSVITISTFYNDYEYRVKSTFIAKNDDALSDAGVGMPSSVVLYTDNSMGIGIGSEKFVAVCELVSGTRVVQ